MPTCNSFAMAAVKVRRLLVLAAVASGLASCTQSPPTQVAATPPPAAPPKTAVAFDTAIASVSEALFREAAPSIKGRRVLVIDPLIDRSTGNQAVATQHMEAVIAAAVAKHQQDIEVKPFTLDTLDDQPLLLVGSISPVTGAGAIPLATDGPVKTYRLWAALADLRTGRILSRQMAWATPDDVDMTPTAFFQDSPVWSNDPVAAAYIRTCSSKPGEPIDPDYLRGLQAEATVAQATTAYEHGRYSDALALFSRARSLPQGGQLRVDNGVYLSYQALGEKAKAEAAFGSLVDNGLARGKLAVKLVFRPNSTRFWPDRQVSGPYPMWIRQIAVRTAGSDSCLRLIGHTSPTGTTSANEILSEARARSVRARLVAQAARLQRRTDAIGRGSTEPLVGTSRDDATDVLDRRVEFEPVKCTAIAKANAGPAGSATAQPG